MKPTVERVREVLSYDPATGIFIWKIRVNGSRRWNTKNSGRPAGSSHNRGYIHIALDGNKYLAHHLAWVHVYGEWPTSFLDHRNLNKKDNRIENLRLASFGENSSNISMRNNNTSGFRGVCWMARRQRWLATITKDKKTYRLGSFRSKELAAAVYAQKAIELYGEFCPEYLRDIS